MTGSPSYEKRRASKPDRTTKRGRWSGGPRGTGEVAAGSSGATVRGSRGDVPRAGEPGMSSVSMASSPDSYSDDDPAGYCSCAPSVRSPWGTPPWPR
ncbi:hypothetical protein ACFW2I_26995 [Streptomyces nigra]|uniref:hypothetical protein n=1 Tax=Streptomyces nigra TaxID=1827580 RepID=UPI0036C8736D